jgi:hypothetical protein
MDLTPAQKARAKRERLAARFNAWIEENEIEPERTSNGEARRCKHKLLILSEEGKCQFDPYLGGIGLAWHLDDFRRGLLSNTGTVRVMIAVIDLIGEEE